MNKHQILLKNIKKNLPELKALLEKVNDHWASEDCIYRYYHNSFKVYYIQDLTVEIYNSLNRLAPIVNEDFNTLYKNGTSIKFKSLHNKNWGKYTRPQLEAFFHVRFFLEMAIKYGKELKEAPTVLPSGWAALLYLYGLRYTD